MELRSLQKIAVVGCGVLGGSLVLALRRCLPWAATVVYAHRASTRRKVRRMAIAQEVTGSLQQAVRQADLVVLATPVCTFEGLFEQMAGALKPGAVVTDVGSTKVDVHRWASRSLPRTVHFVGSHPMAGSEQQGVEYARDDLFQWATCLVTVNRRTAPAAVDLVTAFWRCLGCVVVSLSPSQHDRAVASISHVPHAAAVALVNASLPAALPFAGKGFLDTSRVASGPANVWADIFLTNADPVDRGIERLIGQLRRIQRAVRGRRRATLERLLQQAREKRSAVIDEKLKSKELLM